MPNEKRKAYLINFIGVLAVFLLLAQPAMHLALWLFEQGNRLYRRLKKYGTENN